MLARFEQATFPVNCNRARWMRMRNPVPFRSRKLRLVLGRILLQSDSREAEFEGRSMCYRCLRRFMRFLFWLPPDGASQPHKRYSAAFRQRTTAYLRPPLRQYPPVKRPRVCYANALSEIPSMDAFFRCPRAATPVVPRTPPF